MEPLVLTVDMAGLPQAWVPLEDAIIYHAKQLVAWSLGGVVREFRGGWQRNGTRSRISTKSILAIKGSSELLVGDRRLRLSIRLRNPYVDPISLLQVDLLERWRAGGREDESLFQALVATVNGIAAGVQNTG